jgi:hypothetical protein
MQALGPYNILRQPANPVSGALAWVAIVAGVWRFAGRTADGYTHAALQVPVTALPRKWRVVSLAAVCLSARSALFSLSFLS